MQKVGDYTIESINDITIDIIIEYCLANKEVEWLKDCVNENVKPDKNGHARRKSFIELRKDFVVKFMPEFAPKYESKSKVSMYDRIQAL